MSGVISFNLSYYDGFTDFDGGVGKCLKNTTYDTMSSTAEYDSKLAKEALKNTGLRNAVVGVPTKLFNGDEFIHSKALMSTSELMASWYIRMTALHKEALKKKESVIIYYTSTESDDGWFTYNVYNEDIALITDMYMEHSDSIELRIKENLKNFGIYVSEENMFLL